jgi:hypothetical protein
MKLAGGISSSIEEPREYKVGLDIQGQGIRVLDSSSVAPGEAGDCCEDLQACESGLIACGVVNESLLEENELLQEENDAINGEFDDYIDNQNENNPGVNGWGVPVTDTVEIGGVSVGTVSINTTITSVTETYPGGGLFNIYAMRVDWTTTQSTWPTPEAPQNVAFSIAMRAVYGTSSAGGEIGTGQFNEVGGNSGTILHTITLSPFSSPAAPTIYNCPRFEIRSNNTYNPASPWKPCMFRELGGGSDNNAQTAQRPE